VEVDCCQTIFVASKIMTISCILLNFHALLNIDIISTNAIKVGDFLNFDNFLNIFLYSA